MRGNDCHLLNYVCTRKVRNQHSECILQSSFLLVFVTGSHEGDHVEQGQVFVSVLRVSETALRLWTVIVSLILRKKVCNVQIGSFARHGAKEPPWNPWELRTCNDLSLVGTMKNLLVPAHIMCSKVVAVSSAERVTFWPIDTKFFASVQTKPRTLEQKNVDTERCSPHGGDFPGFASEHHRWVSCTKSRSQCSCSFPSSHLCTSFITHMHIHTHDKF